jgi:hypothetical protein
MACRISWAATASRCLRALARAVVAGGRTQAFLGVDRRQPLVGVVDGESEAAAQLVGEACAARGHGVRRAVERERTADDQAERGCHSSIRAAMAAKRSALARRESWSADAPAAVATRQRRRRCAFLQSRRRARPGCCRFSGMTGLVDKIGEIDAEQFQCRGQSFLVRESKRMCSSAGDGQPGILRQFVFELAGSPAGVAEGHHHVARLAVRGDRLQDVARAGEADVLVDDQRRLPLAERSMQDEAAVGLYRSAEKNRQIGEAFGLQRNVDFLRAASPDSCRSAD